MSNYDPLYMKLDGWVAELEQRIDDLEEELTILYDQYQECSKVRDRLREELNRWRIAHQRATDTGKALQAENHRLKEELQFPTKLVKENQRLRERLGGLEQEYDDMVHGYARRVAELKQSLTRVNPQWREDVAVMANLRREEDD